MTITALVAPQLPYLRRYARALTGRQETGDGLVAVMLERLLADPALFDTRLDPRLALFRMFAQTEAAGTAEARTAAPGGGASVADERLRRMTPLPRRAFLLTALEGFTPGEAAIVLGVDEPTLLALVVEAGREIGRQVATRVLVIEDEPIIAMELESLVESLGHSVIGNPRTLGEAMRSVEREPPGLVLADIRLADGSSGLDAVNQILREIEVPVIFVTAYPEFLLTGKRPEPTFLITKPFKSDMVRAVVSQALFFDTTAALAG